LISPLRQEHQLARSRGARKPSQQPGDAVIARQADTGVAGRHESRFRGDPDITGERDRHAGARSRPGKRRNGRLAHGNKCAGQRALLGPQIGDAVVE
jgi:hypothetical protein